MKPRTYEIILMLSKELAEAISMKEYYAERLGKAEAEIALLTKKLGEKEDELLPLVDDEEVARIYESAEE